MTGKITVFGTQHLQVGASHMRSRLSLTEQIAGPNSGQREALKKDISTPNPRGPAVNGMSEDPLVGGVAASRRPDQPTFSIALGNRQEWAVDPKTWGRGERAKLQEPRRPHIFGPCGKNRAEAEILWVLGHLFSAQT